MAATFNPALTNDISKVRQRLGDTEIATAQIPDETITAYVTSQGSWLAAAYQLALDLAAKWTRRAAKVTIDDQQQDARAVAVGYRELAAQIKSEIGLPPTADSTAFSSIMVGGVDDCRGPLYPNPNCCDERYGY